MVKALFFTSLVVLAFAVSSCGTCPSGINTTDPSCPGYTPYGVQQPGYQQYPNGTYPNTYNPNNPYGTYPQQPMPGQPGQPGYGYPGQYPQGYPAPYPMPPRRY